MGHSRVGSNPAAVELAAVSRISWTWAKLPAGWMETPQLSHQIPGVGPSAGGGAKNASRYADTLLLNTLAATVH